MPRKTVSLHLSREKREKQSGCVITYITHDWGGACQFVELAKKKGREIFALADTP